MLDGHHPRHGFEQFSRFYQRTDQQIRPTDRTLARRRGYAYQIDSPAKNYDLLDKSLIRSRRPISRAIDWLGVRQRADQERARRGGEEPRVIPIWKNQNSSLPQF
jgi:hypothetical protein